MEIKKVNLVIAPYRNSIKDYKAWIRKLDREKAFILVGELRLLYETIIAQDINEKDMRFIQAQHAFMLFKEICPLFIESEFDFDSLELDDKKVKETFLSSCYIIRAFWKALQSPITMNENGDIEVESPDGQA